MKFFKYKDIISEATEIDKDLEDIRYFKGSIQQFNDFWQKKIETSINPHGDVDYIYPVSRKEKDNSLPYQDFQNGESDKVKYYVKTRKKGN